MNETLSKIYKAHHSVNRQAGHFLLIKERGELLNEILGTDKDVLDLGCRDGSLTVYFSKNNNVGSLALGLVRF